MNEEEIDGVLSVLAARVGTPLAQVWQPSRDRVVLGWRDGTLWMIVPRGPFARLHSVDERPGNPQKPFSFQGACRARLHGPLVALTRTAGERVVRMTFAQGALELRLTGRSGGLWLLDGGAVVASFDGPTGPALPELPVRGPGRGVARFGPGEGLDWDRAARAYFERRERELRESDLRARLERTMDRALQRQRRLLEHLEQDLVRADEAPALRRRGELLMGNLWRAVPGAHALGVEDWETGEPVTLTWAEDVPSAQKAAERWFQQARRLERTADRVLGRLDEVAAEIERLRSARERLLETPFDELVRLDRSMPKEERGAPKVAVPWDEWRGPSGERLRIGRNATANRKLVFQASKGHDWWMHLRDRPSAHVVISVARDASPALPTLLAGAELLLQKAGFSAGEAHEVQYARVRDLRAVPGEGASVVVSAERVLRVVADPGHLAGYSVVR